MGTLAQSCSPRSGPLPPRIKLLTTTHVHMWASAPALHHRKLLDQGRQVQRSPRSDKHRTSQTCGSYRSVRPPIQWKLPVPGLRSGHIYVRHLLPQSVHHPHGRRPTPRAGYRLARRGSPLTNQKRLVFAGIAHACLQQQKVHCAVTHPRQRLGRTGEVVEHSIAVHHVVLVRFCWEIAVEI